MSELQKLLSELHRHFSAYLQQDKPPKCENLKQMSICFDQFETKFNALHRASTRKFTPNCTTSQKATFQQHPNPPRLPVPTKTKPITEFSETCNGPNSRNKWLGISRLSRIPDAGWPSRESCQKAVTAEELAAGAKIVAEYRENEQITVDHDADSRQREISRLSPSGHGFDHARLRKELAACCPETFLKAQNRMNELRDEAAKLARLIFERLVVEFDQALQAIALRREEELTAMGIPLFTDKQDARVSLTAITPSTAIHSLRAGSAGASACGTAA
jgi:hypothetical protein